VTGQPQGCFVFLNQEHPFKELPMPIAFEPTPEQLLSPAARALSLQIVEALEADEKDGGYDLTAGMFGRQFSALVVALALQLNPSTKDGK
jgi:hypothetical protein